MEYNIFAPSLMSFVVFVEVKHHVYLTFLQFDIIQMFLKLYQKKVGFVDSIHQGQKLHVFSIPSSHFFKLWWWWSVFSN